MGPITTALVVLFTVVSLSANEKCSKIKDSLNVDNLRMKYINCYLKKVDPCKSAICQMEEQLKCVERNTYFQYKQMKQFRKERCYLEQVSFSSVVDLIGKQSVRHDQAQPNPNKVVLIE